MGGGYFDKVSYSSNLTSTRAAAKKRGVDYAKMAFAYSDSAEAKSGKVHPNLDPKRINKKPFGKLESRDSVDHPESNAILMTFDVTGSNYSRAVEAQQKLGGLMDLLQKYIKDPQIAIAANDDYSVEPTRCTQVADFESDNRVDEHLKNTILVNNGGGNSGESYDLLLYTAARKTVLDCMEKRNKKGYLFMYADEPFFDQVSADQVKEIFGDSITEDIPIKSIIKEALQLYEIYIIWPKGGYISAREQYVKLFGKDRVLELQAPSMICELVASVIAINEEKVVTGEDMVNDLVAAGTSKTEAERIAKIAAGIKRKFKFDTAPAAV